MTVLIWLGQPIWGHTQGIRNAHGREIKTVIILATTAMAVSVLTYRQKMELEAILLTIAGMVKAALTYHKQTKITDIQQQKGDQNRDQPNENPQKQKTKGTK